MAKRVVLLLCTHDSLTSVSAFSALDDQTVVKYSTTRGRSNLRLRARKAIKYHPFPKNECWPIYSFKVGLCLTGKHPKAGRKDLEIPLLHKMTCTSSAWDFNMPVIRLNRRCSTFLSTLELLADSKTKKKTINHKFSWNAASKSTKSYVSWNIRGMGADSHSKNVLRILWQMPWLFHASTASAMSIINSSIYYPFSLKSWIKL